jgi:bifunctional enzyme CysN/CysC
MSTALREPAAAPETDLLRLSTAGSVDDGKSTLIGRLLLDTKQILSDQMAQVEDASRRRGFDRTELALVTDGLRAEREQGITIDVAYRYFQTPRRKFIVADTPGHVQYTRNMVTGASTSDLAVVLVDARNGLTEQSRRHTLVSALLGIRQLVVAVNKMDLVGWSEDRFAEICEQYRELTALLGVRNVSFVPISALHGDNVVDRSTHMGWYDGPSLLDCLETADAGGVQAETGARLPVQWVVRPQSEEHPDYRGYAGQLAGGTLAAGDEVVVLPSGVRATVASVDTFDGPVDRAVAPMSVTVRLSDDVDVSRGDVLCDPDDQPERSQDLRVVVSWMTERELTPGSVWSVKHATRTLRARVDEVESRFDVDTLASESSAASLGLNDIGVVRLRTTEPVVYDPYRRNRTTGGLIVVDEASDVTVGGGILLDASAAGTTSPEPT